MAKIRPQVLASIVGGYVIAGILALEGQYIEAGTLAVAIVAIGGKMAEADN